MRKYLVALVVCGVSAAGVGASFLRTHTRPSVLPGVPVRNYQWGDVSPPNEARSTRGVLIESRPENVSIQGSKRPRLKIFQLNVAGLAVDHCSIHRVGVTVQENGECSLSLQGICDPTRKFKGDDATTANRIDRELRTEHLLRNKFHVSVRVYAAPSLTTRRVSRIVGSPVAFEITPPCFWVQRDQPYNLLHRENIAAAADFFDRIDQMEVDFFYR